jgi:glyoxylase I family protein
MIVLSMTSGPFVSGCGYTGGRLPLECPGAHRLLPHPAGTARLLAPFGGIGHPAAGEGERAMIRGIHHVSVHVRDLDRMIAFYRDAFGFEVVGEPFAWEQGQDKLDTILDVPGSAARGAMLRAGTCYIELFQFSAPAPQSDRPLRPFDKGYTHFCVDVTEIEQEIPRLKALGMSFGDREPVDMGHVKTLYGRDPEGNVIEIQQTADHCDMKLEELAGAR